MQKGVQFMEDTGSSRAVSSVVDDFRLADLETGAERHAASSGYGDTLKDAYVKYECLPDGFHVSVDTSYAEARSQDQKHDSTRTVGMEMDAGAVKLLVACREGGDNDVVMLVGPEGVATYSNSMHAEGIVVFLGGGFQILGGQVNEDLIEQARDIVGLSPGQPTNVSTPR